MDVCRLCENTFETRKIGGGFNKWNLNTRMPGHDDSIYAALQLLYSYEGADDGYLCNNCFLKLFRGYGVYTSMPTPELERECSTPLETPLKKRKLTSDPPKSLPPIGNLETSETEKKDVCRLCKNPFKRKLGSGWKKRKISGKLEKFDVTVHAALQLMCSYEDATTDGYLCYGCHSKLLRGYRAYASGKLTSTSQGSFEPSDHPKSLPPLGSLETSEAEMDVCRLCKNPFKRRRGYGWNKRKISGKLDKFDVTVHAALQLMCSYEDATTDGYLCNDCHLKLIRGYRAYASGKLPSGSLASFQPSKISKLQQRIKTGRRIKSAFEGSKYYSAFRQILSAGLCAEKALLKVVQKKIRKEIKSFNRVQKYPTLEDISSIEDFNWNKLIDDMRGHMPFLTGAVEAAMPFVGENNRLVVLQRIAFMMSIPVYSMNPKKFNFLQALVGVQMWRESCSDKLFRVFNNLGICQGAPAIRRRIRKLCQEQEQKMNKLQQSVVEATSSIADIEPVHSNDEELQSVNSNAKEPQPPINEVSVNSNAKEPQPPTNEVSVNSNAKEPQPPTNEVSVNSNAKEPQPPTNEVSVNSNAKEPQPPTSDASVCSITKDYQSSKRKMSVHSTKKDHQYSKRKVSVRSTTKDHQSTAMKMPQLSTFHNNSIQQISITPTDDDAAWIAEDAWIGQREDDEDDNFFPEDTMIFRGLK